MSLKQKLYLTLLGAALVMGVAVSANADATYRVAGPRVDVNYDVKMGPNTQHDYGIYATGPWNTSAGNTTTISTGSTYRNRLIHILAEQNVGRERWLKFAYAGKVRGWINRNATDKTYKNLRIPLIAQRPELPTGCEITATTMMLQFAGAKVNKLKLAKEMPRSRNPNKGFVGSPYSPGGWYIYPKGLMKLVKKYAGSAKNMTGASFGKIKAQLDRNRPVVVWVANFDGFVNHAITVSGYSKTRVYFNDPWTNKKTSLNLNSFKNHRKRDAYRALSY